MATIPWPVRRWCSTSPWRTCARPAPKNSPTVTLMGRAGIITTKNLSVNYVDAERYLSEGDDGSGKVVEGEEATFELFVSHEQLTEAIEPAMGNLHDPPSRPLLGVAPLELGFLAAANDVRDVAVGLDDAKVLGAAVACIGAKVLAASDRRAFAFDDNGIEHLVESFAVIDVGRGHDERQRDATAVHQQVAFAALFSPDPSGSGRRLPAPRGPSSWPRRHFAIAKRCPPSRRIRPAPPSTGPRRSPLLPSPGSACGWRWRCQSAPWARPSIGNRYEARTRWPRTPAAPASRGAQHRACVGTSCPATAPDGALAVPRAPRMHPSPPTIRRASPLSCPTPRSMRLGRVV